MDKEIIELLKTLASGTETLVIWYMVLDVLKVALGWVGAAASLYMVGFGVAKGIRKIQDDEV